MISQIRKVFKRFLPSRSSIHTEDLQYPSLPMDKLENCTFKPNRYYALEELPKNGKILEVGTLAGDLAAWFYEHLAPEELHLIDHFGNPDSIHPPRFTGERQEEFVRHRFADSPEITIKKGSSWEEIDKYPDQYFDLIYIDAGHSYYAAKKDAEAAVRKIKPTGYLAFNDYVLVDPYAQSSYGVVKAVNELCVNHGWKIKYYCFHPQLFCDVILEKE